MELVVNKLYNIQSSSNLNVESVAKDLVLVNVELKLDTYNFDSGLICSYYFGDFPPLDIFIDSRTGLLKEITFFVDKSILKREKISGNGDYQNVIGYPCFNTDFVEKHEFNYRENCEIIITLRELSLSVARADYVSIKKIIIDANLSILLDEKDVLTGVEINNLGKDYLDLLN